MLRSNQCRRAVALIAVAGAVALLGGCGQGSYTREGSSLAKEKMNMMKSATEWEMARQAFFAGDLDKALRKVDVSLGMNPNVAKSHVLKGRILLEQGEVGLAVRSFNTALAIQPDFVDAHYYVGIAAERLNRTQDAFDHFARATELDEYNDQYPVAAAEMLIDMGKFDEAANFLSRTATLEDSPGVRQTLGHIERLRGNMPAAVSYFQSAQLLAPDDLGILEDLTRAQFAVGQFGDAEYALSQILADPDYAERRDLQRLRAECLVRLNRTGEARQMYLELTSTGEGVKDLDSWIGLGEVSHTVGDFATLRKAATRVVSLAPERQDGYVLWSLWHRQQGNQEATLRSIDDALRRNPENPLLFTMRAMTLIELGRTNEARQALTSALAIDPQHAPSQSVLASLNERVANVNTQD
jgi:tetratricopeptide (TPR) repeat protein